LKTVLFCQNPYAFGILEPIMTVLKEKEFPYLWFVKEPIKDRFPFDNESFTSNMDDVKAYCSDAIFVPGNEVPYYLRGLKVQIFHGLAGEKKGHFRIRHYFDLYLTQGPYFTQRFCKLRDKYTNFDVIETGWPKLDIYNKERHKYDEQKQALLAKFNAKKIVLYAPTFSPSLNSASFLVNEFKKLAEHKDYLILVKFHDLMSVDMITVYKQLAHEKNNIIFEDERNIIKFLLMADILISDTSSVVYEFLLLDKPVLTFKSNAKNIQWDNALSYDNLVAKIESNLVEDKFRRHRNKIVQEYHPYDDGNSASRMVEAVATYIQEKGIPEKRKLSFLRKLKIHKIFGK